MSVGYLGDAQLRGAQQERGFHEEHLVDIIDHCAPRDLANDPREIDRADMKRGGVKRDVMVLGEMVGQQTDEADEDFLNALGRLAMYNGTILGILQVKQAPVNAGKIAEITGIDRKEVDKAFAELKKEGAAIQAKAWVADFFVFLCFQ